MEFSYEEAFMRNIGLVTKEEQEILRTKTIAMPGMGGTGGTQLISLVRQGFERFKIADLDEYEMKNFNRQYGARMDTVGRKKLDVMREEALKINPNCSIELFEGGVNEDNINDFLDGVDLSVDGIDAFEVDTRRLFFNRSLEKGVPVISAGPIGLGSAFLIFLPGGPTFDQYFAMSEKMPYMEKFRLFILGVTPSLLQRPYMKDVVSVKERRGPSSPGSVNICAGIATIYAIKVLLNKGPIRAIPYYHQFDVMRDKYVVKKLRGGNRNWLQRIKLRILRRILPD